MSNTPASESPVTVMGLGLMGQALAEAFLKEGHPTTVWNRTTGKADPLVTKGAKLAGSPKEAVEASSLIIVCVTDYDAVHDMLDSLDSSSLGGRLLVNLTTGTSTQAREMTSWAEDRNTRYLDGAIMAVPQDIATETAVMLYSGPKSAYEEHESTLKVAGPVGSIYLDEDHGLSALYDLSLLNIMWSILNSFLHGAALLETANVKATTFAPLANTMINVVTSYVSAYAPQIEQGEYPAGDATMTVHQGAMEHLAEESDTLGVNAEIPRFFKALVDRAVAEGRADNGYAVMIEQFRKPSA